MNAASRVTECSQFVSDTKSNLIFWPLENDGRLLIYHRVILSTLLKEVWRVQAREQSQPIHRSVSSYPSFFQIFGSKIPLHARGKVSLRSVAEASWTFKINHRKNYRHFLLILTEVWNVLQTFWDNPPNLCTRSSERVF